MNNKILIKRKTKSELREIGSKSKTYDQPISELMKLKKDRVNQQKTVGKRTIDSLPVTCG